MIGQAPNIIQRGFGFIRKQHKSFKMNLIRVSSQNFLTSLTEQYQSIFIIALGADPVQLGVLNSAGALLGAGVAVPTGWFVDKWGIKKIFLIGTPLMVLSALLFAIAPSWWISAPAILLSVLAMRMMMTICPIICATCLRNEERATGMQVCDSLSAAPKLAAPLIAAVIITWFGGIGIQGIRPLFYVQMIGFILLFFFTLKKFENPPRDTSLKNASGFLDGFREVFNLGSVTKRWMLFVCIAHIPMFVAPIYYPVFLSQVKKADQFIISGIATASSVLPLILSVPTGRLADNLGRKTVIFLVTPLYILSLLLFIYAPNPIILLFSGFLYGTMMLGMVTQAAMTAELVPQPLLGRWYGLLGILRGLVGFIAPLTAGIIWSIFGPAYVFYFLIAAELVKLLVLTTIPETLKKTEKQPKSHS